MNIIPFLRSRPITRLLFSNLVKVTFGPRFQHLASLRTRTRRIKNDRPLYVSPIPNQIHQNIQITIQSQSFRPIKYYTIVLAFTRKSHEPQNLTTLYPAVLPFSSIMWGRAAADPPTRFRGLELSEGHVAHTRIIPRYPSCAHTHAHTRTIRISSNTAASRL